MGLREGLRRVGRFLTQWRREQEAAWKTVAEARRGTYTPEVRKLFGSRPPMIDVEVREVAVHVDIHVVSTGKSAQTYTRFRCRFLLGEGPTFKVFPHGVVAAIGTALGVEDVEVGEPRFDTRFTVRSRAPEATGLAWSAEACRIMVDLLHREAVVAQRGVVTLEHLGVLRSAARMDASVALLGELGAVGSGLVETVRGLEGAVALPATGPWDRRSAPGSVLTVRGLPVSLLPRSPKAGLEVLVVAEGRRDLPSFELEVAVSGALSAEPPLTALAADTRHLLPGVGPAAVRWTGARAEVTLPGEPSAPRLACAAELAAALVLGPSALGAYR